MYCKHCGKQLPDDAAVCIGCGRSIKETTKPWGFGVALLILVASAFIPLVGIVAGCVGLLTRGNRYYGTVLLIFGYLFYLVHEGLWSIM